MRGKRGILAVLISAAVVTGLVGQLPSASASKKKKKKVERVEERDYVGGSGLRGAAEGSCDADGVACVRFPVEPGEKFVAIEVVDATGGEVWASVYVYGYSSPSDAHEHVCGASEDPFPIAAGVTEVVVIISQTTGGATNPCAGPATAGQVVATFSNIP